MPRTQSTEAVDCFLNAAANSSGLIQGLFLTALGGILFFIITRAAGAIIGEYAKDAWFTRFERERDRLKAEIERLKSHNKTLQNDVDYACEILADLRGENNRLLIRAIQAEQIRH